MSAASKRPSHLEDNARRPSLLFIMLDQEDLDRLREAEDNPNKFVVSAPTDRHKLGVTTVICLILNRTIGESLGLLEASASYTV